MDIFDLMLSDTRSESTASANQAKISAWNRWIEYCKAYGISDPDLQIAIIINRYRISYSFIAYTRRK